jgi:endonuclease/exonuclease/phosphatase (EEP) superfamily protein YafD
MFTFETPSQPIHKLSLALLAVIWLLTLTSLLGRYVYLELATHFRLQYALASSFCIVSLIGFQSWKALPFAICCALFNWSYVLPYYAGPPGDDAETTASLRLMLANVFQSNKNYQALMAAVTETKPDIIVLQEVTAAWADQVRTLSDVYPHHEVVPRPGGSGMALFSRYPLAGVEVLTLDDSTHLAVLARINAPGAVVTLLSLHPPTPVRTGKFLNRNKQFTKAATILKSIKGSRVLAGDLNTTMWSPYFQKLLEESGLRDAKLGFGVLPSWPQPLPRFLQLPIDHCLVSDDIRVAGISTGGRTGSDHRYLVVDLQLRKEAGLSLPDA